jgi:hypothetical protein
LQLSNATAHVEISLVKMACKNFACKNASWNWAWLEDGNGGSDDDKDKQVDPMVDKQADLELRWEKSATCFFMFGTLLACSTLSFRIQSCRIPSYRKTHFQI